MKTKQLIHYTYQIALCFALAAQGFVGCAVADDPVGRRDASTDRPNVVVRDGGGVMDVPAPRVDGVAGCALGSTMCPNGCRNLRTDESNCGMCGRSCGAAQSCTAGVCGGGGGCAAPRTMCGASCVDTNIDEAHCGRCDNPCPGAESCSAGMCSMMMMMGGGETGIACADNAACGMNALGPGVCIRDFPGGYCSFDCMSDADCGMGGRCIDLGGGRGNICLKECSAGSPCRSGQRCATAPPPNMAEVCIPDCGSDPLNCPAGTTCDEFDGSCF